MRGKQLRFQSLLAARKRGSPALKILGSMMNRQGKMCDAVEERMQSANKEFWKDIKIYKNKDVPWRIKCQEKLNGWKQK